MAEHLERFGGRTTQSTAQTARETRMLVRLLEQVSELLEAFQRGLFAACEEHSFHNRQSITDDKMAQYHQLLVAGLMRANDSLQQQFSDFQGMAKVVQGLEREFLTRSEHVRDGVEQQRAHLAQKTKLFSADFKELLRGWRENPAAEHPAERSVSLHSLMEAQCARGRAALGHALDELARCEAELKERLRALILSAVRPLFPGQGAELAARVAAIEELYDGASPQAQLLARDFGLQFCEELGPAGQELAYLGPQGYLRLEATFANHYCRQLRTKVAGLERKVDSRDRLFISLLLPRLYRSGAEIAPEAFDRLNGVLAASHNLEYFVFNLILQKCVVLLLRPTTAMLMGRGQFRNFQQLSYIALIQDIQGQEFAGELAYHYLRFCTFVICESRETLIELLGRVPLIHDAQFWFHMFLYLQAAFSRAGASANAAASSARLYGKLQVMFGGQPGSYRQLPKNRAFDEVALLLFRIKMDFETVADILIHLARSAGLAAAFVKTVLQQNDEYFFSQIVQSCRTPESPPADARAPPRAPRRQLLMAIKRSLRFFDDTRIVDTLSGVCRDFRAKRAAFRCALLRTATLSPETRRVLIAGQLCGGRGAQKLAALGAEGVDPVIALDVRRTTVCGEGYTASQLEGVLRNVCHPAAGGFPYHQGLNYIANYFCSVFDRRPELAYAAVLQLMRQYFAEFTDGNLEKLKKIFFYFRRLLKAFLPALAAHIESELKLNIDVVLASWGLTLFTTITQYHARSQFLDDAVDLFLARGWAAFLQTVLVIFEALQEKIMQSAYEDVLALLSDLPRNNFSEIAGEKAFCLKERTARFKTVTPKALAAMSREYDAAHEKFADFWEKISEKLATTETPVA